MCLAIAAKVVEIRENGKSAVVEQNGLRKEVVNAVEGLKAGEFVLLQQGIAAERISKEEAEENV